MDYNNPQQSPYEQNSYQQDYTQQQYAQQNYAQQDFAQYVQRNYAQPQYVSPQDLPPQYRPLSAWAYWGLSLLYAVPVVGFIFLIVFTFSDGNINRRNFTRAYWCGLLIAVIVALIILMVTGSLFGIIGNSYY